LQTIEMFEVIVQSQPNDCQSLEILKEAYSKLGREEDVINTSKRIANAYVVTGQLSSAILEYETVLQRRPDDAEVQKALVDIESTASNVGAHEIGAEASTAMFTLDEAKDGKGTKKSGKAALQLEDGNQAMHKIFVDSKIISQMDFELCWRVPDLTTPPKDVNDPFIQLLHERGVILTDKSLKLISDKSRTGFLSLNDYDLDLDFMRGFSADICRRWCILPFDRMSTSILVATANPFNQQAARELAATTTHRLLWYLSPPIELVQNIRKVFR